MKVSERHQMIADIARQMESDVARLKELDQLELDAVKRARENGATWREIGQSLGVSQQAASKKFGKKI